MIFWITKSFLEPFKHHNDFEKFVDSVCFENERPDIESKKVKAMIPLHIRDVIAAAWAPNPSTRPSMTHVNIFHVLWSFPGFFSLFVISDFFSNDKAFNWAWSCYGIHTTPLFRCSYHVDQRLQISGFFHPFLLTCLIGFQTEVPWSKFLDEILKTLGMSLVSFIGAFPRTSKSFWNFWETLSKEIQIFQSLLFVWYTSHKNIILRFLNEQL